MSSEIESFVRDVFGWPGAVRPDTFDLTAIKEVYVEDVYRARGRLEGKRVLDLGANVGVFSVWAMQQGAESVVALECCAETFEVLSHNVEASGFRRIEVRNAAVGPASGTCETRYLGEKDAHKSYVVEHAGNTVMQSLNELGPFDVVKCDVEGMEWHLFHTASTDTMKGLGYIAIEFHGTDAPGSAPQPEGAFGQLVEKLSDTHCVHTLGAAEKGGMIYADVY